MPQSQLLNQMSFILVYTHRANQAELSPGKEADVEFMSQTYILRSFGRKFEYTTRQTFAHGYLVDEASCSRLHFLARKKLGLKPSVHHKCWCTVTSFNHTHLFVLLLFSPSSRSSSTFEIDLKQIFKCLWDRPSSGHLPPKKVNTRSKVTCSTSDLQNYYG